MDGPLERWSSVIKEAEELRKVFDDPDGVWDDPEDLLNEIPFWAECILDMAESLKRRS